MKVLFEQIRTTLESEVPEIRFIDLQKGQLESEEPGVSYPCVLVDVDSNIEFQRMSGRNELATVNLSLEIVFKPVIGSDNKLKRESSLNHWAILNKIGSAILTLQNSYRKSSTKQKRSDLQVYDVAFGVQRVNLVI